MSVFPSSKERTKARIDAAFVAARFLLIFFCGLISAPMLRAQDGEPADTVKKKRIEIINTDVFEFSTTDSNQIRKFTGNVHFRHEGTDFYSRRALQYMDTEIVVADGDVHIAKPDSFDIYADLLIYDSRAKTAEFRGKVIFRDSTAELSTDSLDYDLNTDIGTFRGGGQLVNDSATLFSESGTYFHRRREAIFYGNVHLRHPDYDLYSDSMRYDTDKKIAWFIAPTRIENGEDVIYCESGYYDTKTNRAEFGGHTQMSSGATRVAADHLVYDKKMGYGEARGNVIWQDTAEQITILAHYADYFDSLDYVLATEDPLLIDITDGDTLYLSADTLITFRVPRARPLAVDTSQNAADSLIPNIPDDAQIASIPPVEEVHSLPAGLLFTDTLSTESDTQAGDSIPLHIIRPSDTEDSLRTFIAYRDARILSGRMSGVCDSLFFTQRDSVFRMRYGPVMWVDTTQFTGDSMHMAMRNKALDKIFIYRNALIIHESFPGVYDQTRGKRITGFFDGDYLERLEIDGNGESIYFIEDDSSAYVGGNRSLCARMIVYMKDSTNEVDYITFLTRPEATFTPFSMIDLKSYRLEGYSWAWDRKPKSVQDIVRDAVLYESWLLREKTTAPAADEEADPDAAPEASPELPIVPID